MSATASADLFVDYFAKNSAAPPEVLTIPGRSYPVDIKWMADCERFAATALQGWTGDGNINVSSKIQAPSELLSPRAMDKIDNLFIKSLITKIIEQQEDKRLNSEAKESTSKEGHLGSDSHRTSGAILVFLPGKAEIESLERILRDNDSLLSNRNIYKIFKLHSTIPRKDQDEVFNPALVGTFKIVLATNLAETSITIPGKCSALARRRLRLYFLRISDQLCFSLFPKFDFVDHFGTDVSHVIDTGRVKESRFNSSTRIKELITVWISQASAKQRAGRAGRTTAGVCWRLYSEEFFGQSMPPHTSPEMLRTPLDELILQLCLLYEHRRDETRQRKHTSSSNFPEGVSPVKFLSNSPEPPSEKSIIEACDHLLEVNALKVVDPDAMLYRLTPLGYHLSRLPMDAKVSIVV